MKEQELLNFMEATGTIAYNMTNNYMFRFILQTNDKVLKGLICALLHLKPEQIKSIEIKNPINLAGDVSGKEFILDINVMMNDDTFINLEMQVTNEYNWPERSLSYLCRAYDNLYSGEDYKKVRPVIHIGFLDFDLPLGELEFYATYKLLNVKNHGVYSDKFVLSVLHLNQIELATEEDKAYRIDYWARIFKAETWEELKMYAEKNEYLEEAAEALYVANADEIVRQQCRARKDAEILQMRMQYAIQELEDKNAVLEDKNAVLEDKNAVLEEIKMQLEEEAKRKDELIQVLIKNNRLDDINKALTDVAYRKKLYEELNM